MSRIRRRIVREKRGLTRAEQFYLMSGHVIAGHDGDAGFSWEDDDGWHTDDNEVRAAWLTYRDELLEEAAEHGLIPWAARHFEGMVGRVSPYEHLMGVRLDQS